MFDRVKVKCTVLSANAMTILRFQGYFCASGQGCVEDVGVQEEAESNDREHKFEKQLCNRIRIVQSRVVPK